MADHPELVVESKPGTVSFDAAHQIVIDDGEPGTVVDGEALGDAVADAATGDHSAEIPLTVAEPVMPAGAEDFRTIISSFDTPLTNEYIRTRNLTTAAADIAGTVLAPGGQFDLYKTLSPITVEEGYADAHVIVDGVLTQGIGGGLSQMATTTYNAAYFAGYDIERFRPHSVWFPRYPAGRESTLYGDQINVEFTNDTPYAVIFNSYVENGCLHVDLWSTPYYTVETQASDRTNYRQPGVTEVTAANCEAKGPGQAGFTITNYRQVFLDGEQVKDESFRWTYKADNAIKCVSEDG